MVVVSISKDSLHKAVCFFKQTPLFSQQPLAVWCSLNNRCVRMCVFALSKGSEKIRAKVLKYFKTCEVRLNTLSWYFLLGTWTDMNCRVKSQALLKQILMKAALNLTGSCHSSSEVINIKRLSLTDFSSDGSQYVGEGLFATNLLWTGRGMTVDWWIRLSTNRFTSAH